MDESPGFGTRLLRAVRNLFIVALILGSAGIAVYALSVTNSRTYSLEVRNGSLVVMKGKMMPTGADAWLPGEPALADAYAPLDLEGNVALTVVGKKFEDRDELDRALFQVIEMLARPRLASDTPKDLEHGLALVRRGEKLHGLTDDQRAALKKMQSDVAYFLARVRLDDARRQLEEALVQLKLAAESESKNRQQASLMLLAVEPQVKLLSTTLRATTMTNDAAGGLAKALEPQLQQMFNMLGAKTAQPDVSGFGSMGLRGNNTPEQSLSLTLDKDGKIFLDGEAFATDALTVRLKEVAAKSPTRVVINADQTAPYSQVTALMDLVKGAGIEKVAIGMAPKPAP
ncbi:MAG: biopolymer transporter ExbD [Archangium sp.]